MSRNRPALTKAQLREYDRLMLRSALVSLYWAVISDRKARGGYKLQYLADAIGVDKSGVSRWFSGNDPNWTLDTIADISNALNVDLRVEAIDRETGTVYTAQGRKAEPRDIRHPTDAVEGGAESSSSEKPTRRQFRRNTAGTHGKRRRQAAARSSV